MMELFQVAKGDDFTGYLRARRVISQTTKNMLDADNRKHDIHLKTMEREARRNLHDSERAYVQESRTRGVSWLTMRYIDYTPSSENIPDEASATRALRTGDRSSLTVADRALLTKKETITWITGTERMVIVRSQRTRGLSHRLVHEGRDTEMADGRILHR